MVSAPRSGRGGREFKSPHPDRKVDGPLSGGPSVRFPAGTVDTMALTLGNLQDVIDRTYGTRDRARGVPATVAWLAEEVGELAQAVRKGTKEQQIEEFADVIAWVATLANQMDVDLDAAMARYATGCPKCEQLPCRC